MLNVWRILRSELKLNIYTFESCVAAVLQLRTPHVQPHVLTHWFNGGPAGGGGVVHMHHGYADSSFWLCLFNHIPTMCYSFYTNKVGTGQVLSQPSIHMAEGAKATSDNFCKCCRCACPHHDYISNVCSIATLQAARLESSCSMSEAVQQETLSATLPCPRGCCAPFWPLFLLRVFQAYRSANRANKRFMCF